jgi:acyl-CoA reductase-like NAD-dependent aldehyde dehydrogenase
MVHRPLGAGVVIAPWNFPLAIPCGMTVAALVTGNTVVLKPAEQSPGIARDLVGLLAAVCPFGVV